MGPFLTLAVAVAIATFFSVSLQLAVWAYEYFRKLAKYRATKLENGIEWNPSDGSMTLKLSILLRKEGEDPVFFYGASFIIPPRLHKELSPLYPSLKNSYPMYIADLEDDDDQDNNSSIIVKLETNKPYALVLKENLHKLVNPDESRIEEAKEHIEDLAKRGLIKIEVNKKTKEFTLADLGVMTGEGLKKILEWLDKRFSN
jgi:hypothetical protein